MLALKMREKIGSVSTIFQLGVTQCTKCEFLLCITSFKTKVFPLSYLYNFLVVPILSSSTNLAPQIQLRDPPFFTFITVYSCACVLRNNTVD